MYFTKSFGLYKQFRSFYTECTGEVERIFNALHVVCLKKKKPTTFEQKSNVNAYPHKTEVSKRKKKLRGLFKLIKLLTLIHLNTPRKKFKRSKTCSFLLTDITLCIYLPIAPREPAGCW